MTHLAWVPEGWEEQARSALGGMAERHPSRAILLFPAPDEGVDSIDADVSVERYPIHGLEREVCSEVVELRLNGKRAKAPASIVEPLLISDLPVFLRWRGEPTWESQELEQLVRIADRMIVASTEWDDLPYPYTRLAQLFDRTAVSDIAWARRRWRAICASLWPDIESVGTDPRPRHGGAGAPARQLASLAARPPDVALEHVEAERLEGIALDGEPVPFLAGRPAAAERRDCRRARELDRFTRDPSMRLRF